MYYMNTMLLASSALSVCAHSMHYSTGTEPKLGRFCRLTSFFTFEVGFMVQSPLFWRPYPQCSW